jgi:drug/metabolite transporter (DMT)-like permease
MTNLRLGFFFMLAAAFTYSIISCFSYSLETRLSMPQIVFFQDFLALLTLLPWLKYKKHSLKTEHFPLHLVRDIAALAAFFFWLMSLRSLGLVNSAILQFTSPFYVPFFGYLCCRERIPKGIWKAITLGFIGVVLILKPNSNISLDGVFWGILAGIASALGLTFLRQLNLKKEPFERTMFYLFFTSTVIMSPFAALQWKPISWHDAGLLCLAGICILGNNILLTRAFYYAPGAYLAPMSYLAVLFNGLWGYLFFNKTTDLITFVCGAFVLIGASLIYFLKDKQKTPDSI